MASVNDTPRGRSSARLRSTAARASANRPSWRRVMPRKPSVPTRASSGSFSASSAAPSRSSSEAAVTSPERLRAQPYLVSISPRISPQLRPHGRPSAGCPQRLNRLVEQRGHLRHPAAHLVHDPHAPGHRRQGGEVVLRDRPLPGQPQIPELRIHLAQRRGLVAALQSRQGLLQERGVVRRCDAGGPRAPPPDRPRAFRRRTGE